MATSAPRLIGAAGDELTGLECRVLRAALNLERRHVVALANALGVGQEETTMARVTAWERSKGRGYPAALVRALDALDAAVQAWAADAAMARGTSRGSAGETAVDPGGGAAVLTRPVGAEAIMARLNAGRYGLALTTDQVRELRTPNDDFWHALGDGAVARAALMLRGRAGGIRIAPERDPG